VAALLIALLALVQTGERIATLQVQGNVLTSESEVLQLAAVAVGQPLEEGEIERIAGRLRDTGRFKSAEVLKRYASIADPLQIALIIVVDEGPVSVMSDPDAPGGARVRKRRGPELMFGPIFGFEDGYGFAYGMRTSIPEPLGPRSRISVPFSWGADKRLAVEVLKERSTTIVSRIGGGLSLSARENPYYDADDDRRQAWVRGERDFLKFARAGTAAAFERVSFLGEVDHLTRVSGDLVLDTRFDPMLARNAIYAKAGAERVWFDNRPAAWRSDLEARGYLGLPGQSVAIARVARQSSDRSQPPFLQPLLGGIRSVRGYALGTDAGDTLVSASLEWRAPLTSPLRVGKIGISGFADVAAAYDNGEDIRRQKFKQGVGGGVWFSAAMLRFETMIARGIGGSTRAHFQLSLPF